MKKLILIILLSITCGYIFSQNGHLIIEQNRVIWLKNIKGPDTAKELTKQLYLTGNFYNIYNQDGIIVAELKPLPVNFKGAGYNIMNTSMYLSGSNISAIIVIDVKKMEVVAKNIIFEQTANLAGLDAGIKNIEFYALKNSQFRKGFLKRDKKTIEFDLSQKIGL